MPDDRKDEADRQRNDAVRKRAKAIADVARVIVDSAKVEVNFIEATGEAGSGFIKTEPTRLEQAKEARRELAAITNSRPA